MWNRFLLFVSCAQVTVTRVIIIWSFSKGLESLLISKLRKLLDTKSKICKCALESLIAAEITVYFSFQVLSWSFSFKICLNVKWIFFLRNVVLPIKYLFSGLVWTTLYLNCFFRSLKGGPVWYNFNQGESSPLHRSSSLLLVHGL